MLEQALTTPTLRVRRTAARLLAASALALSVGCGGASVSVPPMLPVPLVDRIPLSMGYHLSEELLGYVHQESLEDSGDWTIEFGSAQTTMFANLLGGMFESAVPVAGPAAAGQAVDAVLLPSIEEVQFSTPDQTRSDYFEVWVRYRMRLHGRDGALVAEWPLTAYGKANARNYGMNSREPALQAAALAAMRDAMAFFTVQFRTVPSVQAWLDAELGAQTDARTGGASP